MYGYIYLIEDTKNCKKYIGQHKNKNMLLDKNYHGSGTFIKKIRKSRPETLVESIICSGDSIEELNFFENYFILKFNTLYPNGYNYKTGCDSIKYSEDSLRRMSESQKNRFIKEKNPFFGRKHSEETKQKIREKALGRKHSEETCKKLREKLKGIKRSEETRKKISNSRKNNIKISKQVLQFTLDGKFIAEYPSIREAARQTGCFSGHISKCCLCKHNYKSAGGFLWKYKHNLT